MRCTALLSVKDKTDIEVIAGGLLHLEREDENWQLVGVSQGTETRLRDADFDCQSGYDFLMTSPLSGLAELLGQGDEHREERTQLLALLALVNGKLPGWPEVHMVVGCPTPLKEKVKIAETDQGVGAASDASGLSLLSNGMRGGSVVVPHHRFYREVVAWLQQGRPSAVAMREHLQAETSLVLGLHGLDDYRFILDHRTKGFHA